MGVIYNEILKIGNSRPELKLGKSIRIDELNLVLHSYNLQPNEDLLEYFGSINGVIIGLGALLGIKRDLPFLSVEFYKNLNSFILTEKILPIATDGTGNIYVIVLDKSDIRYGSVYFIDLHTTPFCLEYVVASSLVKFLKFILKFYRGEAVNKWPYSKQFMEELDPDLFKIKDVHLFIWD